MQPGRCTLIKGPLSIMDKEGEQPGFDIWVLPAQIFQCILEKIEPLAKVFRTSWPMVSKESFLRAEATPLL